MNILTGRCSETMYEQCPYCHGSLTMGHKCPGQMNLSMRTAIREYVAAEAKLAVMRHDKFRHAPGVYDREISELEAQSTRMETDIRKQIEAGKQRNATLNRVAAMNTRLR